MVKFYLDHMCPLALFNPHHSSHKYLYSLWPAIPFLSLFSFFFSQTHKHSLTLSHWYLHATISTIIFPEVEYIIIDEVKY